MKTPPPARLLLALSAALMLTKVAPSLIRAADAVSPSVANPGPPVINLNTEYFPITKATAARLTAADIGATAVDPFAAPSASTSQIAGAAAAIQAFFQNAGVDFAGVKGSALAYDGSIIIVTQTPREIEKIRTLLARINNQRPVSVEGRFFQVKAAAVAALKVNWTDLADQSKEALARARFSSNVASDINWHAISPAAAKALEDQLARTDEAYQMGPYSIAVYSEHPATFTWAQEIHFFDDTLPSIRPGPVVNARRKIGIELWITPTVEHDQSLSLDLIPRITDFNGFIVGGAQTVVAPANREVIDHKVPQSGTVVTMPPRFFLPVFHTRESTTKFQGPDGTTLVLTFPMGGLVKFDGKAQTLPAIQTGFPKPYPILDLPPIYMGVVFLTAKTIPAPAAAPIAAPAQKL